MNPLRNLFCFVLSLFVANEALATPALADDSRFLVVLACLQAHPSDRCNAKNIGYWRFVGNSGGSWHSGRAVWPSGMGGELVAKRLTGKSMVIDMDNVTLPLSLQNKASEIHLVFRSSFVGGQVYAGRYTESDDGKVSQSTWYAIIPSAKDQIAYSNAMDQGDAASTQEAEAVAQFNANLMRNAMNGIINNANKIGPMPSYPGAAPGY